MKDFPLFRSARAGLTGTLLIAAPLLALSFTPLTGVYTVILTLFLLPAALCVAGLVCGLMPMALSAAAGIFALYNLAGTTGALLSAVYLLPICAVFVGVVTLRVPFWRSCALMIGTHVLCLAGVYLLLQNLTGGELYTAAGDAVVSALQNWELGDTMLYQMYGMGLITLPDSLAESAILPVVGGYMLSDAARSDLLLSVRTLVTSSLMSLTPSLIVSQSILGGVGALFLPLRLGFVAAERRAFRSENAEEKIDFPDLGMPPLSLWHLPRGVGWQVGAALAIGYLLGNSAAPGAAIGGRILYAAASAVFMIQGAALINFMQKAKGTRLLWRVLVPALLLVLSILSFIGIFDQITNIRRLRKPKEPKEE